jgi:hypothetical protein
MNIMNKSLCGLALFLLLSGLASAQISSDDAIDLLEEFPAAKLDSLLPKTPFLTWFKSVVGGSAKLQWEVNDCGEQTGVPMVDQQRDLPVCLEVSADLPDNRKVGVAVWVGTEKKGLTDTPAVYDIYLQLAGRFYHVKRLSDLPKSLRQYQRQ